MQPKDELPYQMQIIAEALISCARDTNEVVKFQEINVTAIRKILKKFNKQFHEVCY